MKLEGKAESIFRSLSMVLAVTQSYGPGTRRPSNPLADSGNDLRYYRVDSGITHVFMRPCSVKRQIFSWYSSILSNKSYRAERHSAVFLLGLKRKPLCREGACHEHRQLATDFRAPKRAERAQKLNVVVGSAVGR